MSGLTVSKKAALKSLEEKISEGESILKEIRQIRTSARYSAMVEIHDYWYGQTTVMLRQIFDDEKIADHFSRTDFFVPRDPPLPIKVSEFTNDATEDLAKLKEISKSIQNDLYLKSKSAATFYKDLLERLQNIKPIAILLIVVAVLLAIFEIANKGADFVKLFSRHTDKTLVSFKDMGIRAWYIKKKDSTVAHTLTEAEIESILGDSRKILEAGGDSTLNLAFAIPDTIPPDEGFKFQFSAAFYYKLAGWKAKLPGWSSHEIDGNNREYYKMPPLDRTLTFTATYADQ